MRNPVKPGKARHGGSGAAGDGCDADADGVGPATDSAPTIPAGIAAALLLVAGRESMRPPPPHLLRNAIVAEFNPSRRNFTGFNWV